MWIYCVRCTLFQWYLLTNVSAITQRLSLFGTSIMMLMVHRMITIDSVKQICQKIFKEDCRISGEIFHRNLRPKRCWYDERSIFAPETDIKLSTLKTFNCFEHMILVSFKIITKAWHQLISCHYSNLNSCC